jgi:hypothetical protein
MAFFARHELGPARTSCWAWAVTPARWVAQPDTQLKGWPDSGPSAPKTQANPYLLFVYPSLISPHDSSVPNPSLNLSL